jgi:hypothetical protein
MLFKIVRSLKLLHHSVNLLPILKYQTYTKNYMRLVTCILSIFLFGCADTSPPSDITVASENDAEMRLKIQLSSGWKRVGNEVDPATFIREAGSGTFQVSWALYSGEKKLNVTLESLKKMAEQFLEERIKGKMIMSASGKCRFGMFGTSVFSSSQYPRFQVWFVSDGRDHIMATHICSKLPEQSEIEEVRHIAESLALGP